jgi:hypothetical protein
METDPVSETLCFLISRISDVGQSPDPPANLSIIHHCRNPLESSRCLSNNTTSDARRQKETNFKFTLSLIQLHIQRELTLWLLSMVRSWSNFISNESWLCDYSAWYEVNPTSHPTRADSMNTQHGTKLIQLHIQRERTLWLLRMVRS